MKSLTAAMFLITIGIATPLFAQTSTPVQQSDQTAMPTAQVPAAPPVADSDHSMAIALLDRALKVLDTTVNGKDGNGGNGKDSKDGKVGNVTIDRALLDEVRAELTQVKSTLESAKKESHR